MPLCSLTLPEPLSAPRQQDQPPAKASSQALSSQEIIAQVLKGLEARMSAAASASGGVSVCTEPATAELMTALAAAEEEQLAPQGRAANAETAEPRAGRTAESIAETESQACRGAEAQTAEVATQAVSNEQSAKLLELQTELAAVQAQTAELVKARAAAEAAESAKDTSTSRLKLLQLQTELAAATVEVRAREKEAAEQDAAKQKAAPPSESAGGSQANVTEGLGAAAELAEMEAATRVQIQTELAEARAIKAELAELQAEAAVAARIKAELAEARAMKSELDEAQAVAAEQIRAELAAEQALMAEQAAEMQAAEAVKRGEAEAAESEAMALAKQTQAHLIEARAEVAAAQAAQQSEGAKSKKNKKQ